MASDLAAHKSSLWRACTAGISRICEPKSDRNNRDWHEKLSHSESHSQPSRSETLRSEPSRSAPSHSEPSHSSSLQSSDEKGLPALVNRTVASTSKYSVDRSASSKRLRTFITSFKYLYKLSPQQVDDFMASYVIYNLDWKNEDEMIRELGPNYSERVGDCLRTYYGVLNHLCALGDVEKMYIPPLMDYRASPLDNQLLYEESVARHISLKAGDKVLDLGCGRGRVAAHIAKVANVQVTGMNIDPDQVAQAQEFNIERGYNNTFVIHDQNDLPLPFEDNQFDAFYQIQALSLCKDLPGLFKELYRIVKPGSKISLLDWVSLPPYDPSNAEHLALMRRVKPLIGAVGTPTPKSLGQDLEDAGFKVIQSDNASIDGLQAPVIDKVDIYFRAMRQIILAMVKVHLLPAHFKILINRLCLDGQAFVKMDKMRLISTSYRIIAVKSDAEESNL